MEKRLKRICVKLLILRWLIYGAGKIPAIVSFWEAFLSTKFGETVEGWFLAGTTPWKEISLLWDVYWHLFGIPMFIILVGFSLIVALLRSNMVYRLFYRLKSLTEYVAPSISPIHRVYIRYFDGLQEGCVDIQKVKYQQIGTITISYSDANGCAVASTAKGQRFRITDDWIMADGVCLREVIYDERVADTASKAA